MCNCGRLTSRSLTLAVVTEGRLGPQMLMIRRRLNSIEEYVNLKCGCVLCLRVNIAIVYFILCGKTCT